METGQGWRRWLLSVWGVWWRRSSFILSSAAGSPVLLVDRQGPKSSTGSSLILALSTDCCLSFSLYLYPPATKGWRGPLNSALLSGPPNVCFTPVTIWGLGQTQAGLSPCPWELWPAVLPSGPKYCPCWDPATSLLYPDQYASSLAYTVPRPIPQGGLLLLALCQPPSPPPSKSDSGS